MARRRGGNRDETEMSPLLNDADETGWSTASNDQLRFMVLGGDDDFMDKACGTILGERENRDAFTFGELKPRKARVCGREVSVLKTPSHWLKHLKSYYILSNGVKSLKNDLQYFELLLFPGPHVFLLVHSDVKNSGREYYLLKALSGVFGKEVLDYCMVLFIDEPKHSDPIKNTCLKMCGGRHHTLQNTDESLTELFEKTVTQKKHLARFRAAENYFEAKYKENFFQGLKEELISYQDREKQLNNDLKALESSEKQMSEDFKRQQEDLIIYQDRVRQREKDNEKLQREVEQLRDNEKQLQSNLTAAKVTEGFLNSRLQSECDMIQRKEEIQVKEKELHEKERELDRRVEELDKRERNLDEREKQLEIRESEVRKTDRGSSEHHQTTAVTPSDDCEGELKSREHSQTSESHGIHKPVRRNSIGEPPDMSESGPLHTL